MPHRLKIAGLQVNQDDSFRIWDKHKRNILLTGRLDTARDNSGGLWLLPTQGQILALQKAGFKLE